MEGIFTFRLTIGIHMAGYLKNKVTEWFFKLGVSLMLNIQSSLVNVEIGEQD